MRSKLVNSPADSARFCEFVPVVAYDDHCDGGTNVSLVLSSSVTLYNDHLESKLVLLAPFKLHAYSAMCRVQSLGLVLNRLLQFTYCWFIDTTAYSSTVVQKQ